ncbi:MAG: low molecular weight protein-tyrosine-phosphatase [Wolinella sp.]
MKSILFVCLGNICRSPLAEGVARRIVSENGLFLRVDSAGTSGWHAGEAPCDGSINVAKHHGIDISALRSRQVNASDIDEFDLLVAMDKQNLSDLARNFPREKLALLGDFGLDGADVPDPYHYHDGDGFLKVFEMIERGVMGLFAEKGILKA